MFSSLDKWEVVNSSLPQRNVPFPTTSEAQEFFRMYHSYSEITNPSDRMRWCRYSLGLLQKDVAAMVGMEEWLYRDLESGTFHRSFTPELADKLAALYSIPVEDILDDYTLFLHRAPPAGAHTPLAVLCSLKLSFISRSYQILKTKRPEPQDVYKRQPQTHSQSRRCRWRG